MDIEAQIATFTPDRRVRRILTQAATVDDSPSSRRVLKAALGPLLTALVQERAPRMREAVQAFVCAPDPRSIHRGLQALIWLNEDIPPDQDRELLMMLGMDAYIEAERKGDVGRQIIDGLTVV